MKVLHSPFYVSTCIMCAGTIKHNSYEETFAKMQTSAFCYARIHFYFLNVNSNLYALTKILLLFNPVMTKKCSCPKQFIFLNSTNFKWSMKYFHSIVFVFQNFSPHMLNYDFTKLVRKSSAYVFTMPTFFNCLLEFKTMDSLENAIHFLCD